MFEIVVDSKVVAVVEQSKVQAIVDAWASKGYVVITTKIKKSVW